MFASNGNYLGAVAQWTINAVRRSIGQLLIFLGVITLAFAVYLFVTDFPTLNSIRAELIHVVKSAAAFISGMAMAVLGALVYGSEHDSSD